MSIQLTKFSDLHVSCNQFATCCLPPVTCNAGAWPSIPVALPRDQPVTMIPDHFFMQRALELARLGVGTVSPNPLVGCVIVHDGKIIGEGWHRKYGEAHAEVKAIASVADSSLLSEATLFVNMEPCSHFGKTPPCADLLIQRSLKRVVISTLDTNPLVAGKGAKKLREAGMEVITGVLHEEGREINQRFFAHMELKRPYIILKWAETADGFMARENYESKWISNELSRQRVHQWRAEEDAVLVGTNTAQYDNPRLNVRDWSGRNPTRLVIDCSLRLNEKLHLFDGSQPTICYNLSRREEFPNLIYVPLGESDFLPDLLADLYQRKIQSVMVEGGATTLGHFIAVGRWDEARVFRSKTIFGKGIAAPVAKGIRVREEDLMGDGLVVFENEGGN